MAGKKTKNIEKEPKTEKAAPKKEKTSGDDWDIFTDTFKERLSQFISLNQEVLELKGSVEGSDQTDQINENKKRMADKVEQAATEILKEQVASLEDWIKEQQKTVNEDTKKIETAYEANRASLLATGAFTEEEVKNQLASVQLKAEEKKQIYSNYEDLLTRASSIYN